jgi:phage terminase large subunit GpA-like protein
VQLELNLSPQLWAGTAKALTPPEKLTPSQWATRYRILSRRQSSRPGPWDNRANPVLVGIMDLPWRHREIRKMHLRKLAQGGGSEGARNMIGMLAHLEPDPVLLVLPDEKTGKRIMNKRILPLFEDTPALKELATAQERDQGLTQVILRNGFTLQLGWSGSPAALASDPARVVIFDETDKTALWRGKEAGTQELIDVRTATYENSLIFNLSTPTTEDGPISVLCENAPVKLFYFVPCPHCGQFQRLAFERIRYPHKGRDKPVELGRIDDADWQAMVDELDKHKRAAMIEIHRAGWYECQFCSGVVLDAQKQKLLLAGYWGTEDGGYKLFYDGREEGQWPKNGIEVAIQYPAQYSLAAKHKWYRMAAEWIRCEGDPQRTQGFRNSWLAEPYKIEVIKPQASVIETKRDGAPPPMVIPSWARLLIATADMQGYDPSTRYFYYVIRAWGYEYRSQLIDYGIINTSEELILRCLNRPIPCEAGGQAVPQMLLIDSGDHPDVVYQLSLSDTARIKPTKGANRTLQWPVEKSPQKKSGVVLWWIDTEQTKDLLSRLITDPDPATWRVHSQINADYCQQLTAEEKVMDPKTKRIRWKKKTSSTPNHLLDCEQQQVAAAWDAGCGMPEPPPTAQQQPVAPRNEETTGNPLNYQGRW